MTAYGVRVRGFEVTTLNRRRYEDREHPHSPILEPTGETFGWNAGKMHHIDPWFVDGRWRCAVDGNINLQRLFGTEHWTIGIYDA